MAGLIDLLRWQWRAYWRRILRGGTAARGNLVVLALIAAAGFARYITFLRDIRGNSMQLQLLAAGLLLLCIQPGWDAANLALDSRSMARFPLAPFTRLGVRLLSRFVAPISWLLTAVCIAGLWPFSIPAKAALAVSMLAAFAAGVAIVDLGRKAIGGRFTRGPRRSSTRMTPLRRELRLATRFIEVRTAWFISAALCFYLATAGHPEPDAIRVMLGFLAFLTVAAAMNSFGPDGVPGLDRLLLWPIKSPRILVDKNVAFAITIGGPLLPLAALAAWRFGWREGLADFLEAAAIILAVLAWGNITSVRRPESLESASGGNIFDQLVAMAAIAMPAAASVTLLRSNGNSAPAYIFALTMVCALAYAASLTWSAQYLARHHEQIREQL